MAQHLVTVCVFCVLCATHAPCYAHTGASPVTKYTVPSEKYSEIESHGFSEHLSVRTEPTVIPQFKNPKGIENVNDLLNKVPDKKFEDSHFDEKLKENLKNISAHNQTNKKELLQDQLIQKQEELTETQKELVTTPMVLDDSLNLFEDSTVHHHNVENLRSKRGSKLDGKYFIKKIIDYYGNGGKMTMEEFDKLLINLGLFQIESKISQQESHSIDSNQSGNNLDKTKDSQISPELQGANKHVDTNEKCLNSRQLLSALSDDETYESANKNATLPGWLLESVCPALVYQLAAVSDSQRGGCVRVSTADYVLHTETSHYEDALIPVDMFPVWLWASTSVVGISLVGLVGIAVIPLMGKSYYPQVLQFLVALAVGTLCGDAFIHLLPHSMMMGSELSHSHQHSQLHLTIEFFENQHRLNIWKGLVAVLGVVMFFLTEKGLNIVSEWLKYRRNRRKMPVRVRVMRESDAGNSNNVVGEKLSKHKYSTYPYCYGEVATETHDNLHRHSHNNHEKQQTIEEEKPLTCNSTNCNSVSNKIMQSDLEKKGNDDWKLDDTVISDTKKVVDGSDVPLNDMDGYTVIIREHDVKHHTHGHTHNHVHSTPDSMSSVAMMVIMGDGLHNFTDGMAIGAAFYGSIGGGFSTALAVLCHELPHELGDFAVLLKTGMSIRQAIFYNLLSSILCFMGMILGIVFGAAFDGISWIFALTSGIFIYIALVDMIPELSSNHSVKDGAHWQCLLQAIGMTSGFGLMLIIALYEHDLQHIFNS